MRLPLALYGCCVICLSSPIPRGAKMRPRWMPKHYTVISENDQVRILKVHYGPPREVVMHHHPDTVAVFLTDANRERSVIRRKKKDFMVKAGDAQYSVAETHLPENTSDKGMDVIVIELKGKAAHAAKSENEVISTTAPGLALFRDLELFASVPLSFRDIGLGTGVDTMWLHSEKQ